MYLHRCTTSEEYALLINSPAFATRWMIEHHLARTHAGPGPIRIPGFCTVCQQAVDFTASYDNAWRAPDGVSIPNWRDYLRCPTCTMNGRQRLIVQLIVEWVMSLPQRELVTIYMMEQISPLYRWATTTFPRIRWIGSEYLGPNCAPPSQPGDIRHEDAEALTLASESVDLVISCDVLEHVNDPQRALTEASRILRPGGRALLTFPMDPNTPFNQRRATLIDGRPHHLLPPIYHGNPLSEEGSLVFTDFGWEVLAQLRAAGFDDATLNVYWAYELGYLGVQFYFLGHKSSLR
ncbi:MAG: class I SAM-dependent methyltransferase [Deltaproteobacteria bacterium]|nr:class I SAM-dependent methyltransferase [Deltaproteobacteria bacterium]